MSSEHEYTDNELINLFIENKLTGTDLWSFVCIIYLIYNTRDMSACVFLPIDIDEVFPKSIFNTNYGDKLLVFNWDCKNSECNFNSPGGLDILEKCINSSERLVVIPFNLYGDLCGVGHANMLIYDKQDHTLERFDPNTQTDPCYSPELLDNNIAEYFKNYLNDDQLKYIPPSSFCPKKGPQIIEKIYQKEFGSSISLGSCTIWSLLYAYVRIAYPTYTREEVLNFLIEDIHNESENIYVYVKEVLIILIKLTDKIVGVMSNEELTDNEKQQKIIDFVVNTSLVKTK
jgi:hypothetical protein